MFPPRLFPPGLFPPRLFPKAGVVAGLGHPQQARSGVARSGSTLSDLLPREVVLHIGGVVRGVMPDSFTITHTLGQPSQFSGRFNNDLEGSGFEPLVGQQLTVSDETSGTTLLFGGTITSRTLRFMEVYTVQDPTPRKVAFWDVQARDWTWLMDKQTRVFQRFDDVPCSVAVARLLDLCDPALGMRVGIIPAALGNITRTFDGEAVSAAIGEVAQAANAFWRIRPNKRVDMFRDEAIDGNPLVIGDASRVNDFTLQHDLDQIRTVVEVEGGGGQTTAVVSAGATTIPVSECSWYTGGTLLKIEHMRPTYTGRTAASGPGSITGVSGLTDEVAQNTTVSVLARAVDAAAQTVLAATLGGGYSGVANYFERDTRLTMTAMDGIAAQNLTFYKQPLEQVTYGTEDRFHWPGKLVSVALTMPAAYEATLRVHGVTITFRGMQEGMNRFQLFRTITARPGKRATVLDLFAGA